MLVETPADRAAFLADFGLSVRLYPQGEELDVQALYDAPTSEVGGVASELEFLEPSHSLVVLTAELGGLVLEDRVDVLEGPGMGSYQARSIVAEEDGEFSRVDLLEV